MARYLITGGAGYIGSHVALLLADGGEEVRLLDDLSTCGESQVLSRFQNYQVDTRDRDAIEEVISEFKPDVVVHCAAKSVVPESISDPIKYYDNNIVGTLNIVSACSKFQVDRLIFSSTAAVYAPSESGVVTEESEVNPLTPYGRSKLMCEQILRDVASTCELSVGILRYFNVTGADRSLRSGQSTPNATHLIKSAVRCALEDKEFSIFGEDYSTPDGTCIRDFIDVVDLASAHLAMAQALEATERKVLLYNCGTGKGVSVLEVIDAVQEVAGRKMKITKCDRRKGDLPVVVADPARINDDLGWVAEFNDLLGMVKSSYEWERKLMHGSEKFEG